jgi:hypothetical protein
VGWVNAAIAADRKVTALKQLQGHIWRAGFTKGEVRTGQPTCLPGWWVGLGLRCTYDIQYMYGVFVQALLCSCLSMRLKLLWVTDGSVQAGIGM